MRKGMAWLESEASMSRRFDAQMYKMLRCVSFTMNFFERCSYLHNIPYKHNPDCGHLFIHPFIYLELQHLFIHLE